MSQTSGSITVRVSLRLTLCIVFPQVTILPRSIGAAEERSLSLLRRSSPSIGISGPLPRRAGIYDLETFRKDANTGLLYSPLGVSSIDNIVSFAQCVGLPFVAIACNSVLCPHCCFAAALVRLWHLLFL
jgi:hypothetical protein